MCQRLTTDCVPGRPGCVLSKNSVFAVPVEKRIREKNEARDRAREKLFLTSPETASDFSHLNRPDQLTIHEILSDTLPELPELANQDTLKSTRAEPGSEESAMNPINTLATRNHP